MENPRFPHKAKIFRAKTNDEGLPEVDENGDPYSPVLVFETICGYREQSKPRTSGEVMVADFKISLPKHQMDIYPGDIIEMTDYSRTFSGKIVKSIVFNMGANIWFNETRN